MATSVDPYQMPHLAASDMGLHCLLIYLIRNYLSFLFLCLFSYIYHKNNFTAKIGLTYAISIVNWISGISLLENVFCFSSQTVLDY